MRLRALVHVSAFLLAAAPAVLSAPPAATVAPVPRLAAAGRFQPEASEPTLTGPVEAAFLVELKVKNVPKGTAIIWDVYPEDRATTRILKSEQALLFAGPAGDYRVKCRLIKGEDVTELKWSGKLTGGVAPVPPGPDPKPPTPPTPAPEGFRVIFVYESSAVMTPAMQQVMFGEKVRTYLDAKSKGWRRFDRDVDAANEKDANLKALWQAARPQVTAVPCVIVAAGSKAEILPFPASEDEAVKLFTKYGN